MSFATTEAFAINSMMVSTRTGKLISNFAVGLQILSSLKVIEIMLILLDLLNMSKTDWKKCICYLPSVLMDKNWLYNIIYCIAGFGVLEQWKKAAKNKLHSSHCIPAEHVDPLSASGVSADGKQHLNECSQTQKRHGDRDIFLSKGSWQDVCWR